MKLDIFSITPFKNLSGPPLVEKPLPDFLLLLGEEGIRELVSDHYNLLVCSDIKDLFPSNIEELKFAKLKASDFFIQICGGEKFYNQNRGNPMLRKRHFPFDINPKAREVWLECYREALLKRDVPYPVLLSFWNYIDIFSLWMVNKTQ